MRGEEKGTPIGRGKRVDVLLFLTGRKSSATGKVKEVGTRCSGGVKNRRMFWIVPKKTVGK